jgi:hypothetical protein
MKILRIAVVPLALLGACSTQVQNTGTYVPPAAQSASRLPRPQRVLVTGFAADWSQVGLDRGIGARLQRGFGGGDSGEQQVALAADVRDAVIQSLVGDVTKMGFPAQEAAPGASPAPGDLVVQGQITEIDQGNRTRRLAVGFGAGMSQVRADAQVFLVGPDGSMQLLQTYSGDANSGRKPGLAVGAASAAAQSTVVPLVVSGALGASSEARKTGVAGEAQRLGHRIGYNLGQFFVAQGWIPASSAPAIELR